MANNHEGAAALLLPQLARLEVSEGSATHSSDPSTPIDSPLTLDPDLREWLNAALSASANPKVYTKLLVSNAAAGSIIGKGGGNINDFQQKTFAKIQLSKASEYFPGTVERILMLTGRVKQVSAALNLIFSKLSKEGVAPLSPKSKAALAAAGGAFSSSGSGALSTGSVGSGGGSVGPGDDAASSQPATPPPPAQLRLLVKLLVPQTLCGIIIGRSGCTIRQFASDTQTSIKVTAADGPTPPLSHRIVTVTGLQEGVVKAIALLTLKMSEDQKYSLYNTLPVAGSAAASGVAAALNGIGGGMGLGAAGGGGMPAIMHSSMGMGSPYGPAPMQPLPYMQLPPQMYAAPQMVYPGQLGEGLGGGGAFTSLAINLTEEQGIFLLGQDGRGAADVAQACGVRVKVDKEMRPGGKGQYRKLLLAGPVEGVQFAQWLLSQKLAMASAVLPPSYANGGYDGNGAAGMVPPPSYVQQQVAGTTYFQALVPSGPHHHHQMAAPYSPVSAGPGLPPGHYPMPPMQQVGAGPQQVRMVALGVPQQVPLRGRAPA